jgi:hypothetical protein
MANRNHNRKDTILVISRMAPHKKIENAINLAKILSEADILIQV